ncbi:pentapeptide repeat-containing protein [Nocardia sp. NPDC060256]|uniref:pentapeptide repeat-containing protein n=1 Tax=unclassified Nocardia TaxID=2637762 RepID=UPI00366313AD
MTGRVRRGGAVIVRRVAAVGLFWSIAIALLLGFVLAVTAQWVLHRFIDTSTTALAAPIDVTKLSLTVVAGAGGVVALVVAYRRQRDIEQGRFVERFGAAAAQLGAADVAVRIAGVYAMAAVADESRGLRRQQCIDVLCGYLRLPYDPGHGASGRTKLVVKAPRVEHGQLRPETEEHIEYRQNDREVRKTIVRVIVQHLRPTAEYSWSANDFDFRTAHLETPDFSSVTFAGACLFENTTFSGTTRFGEARFSGTTRFEDATFSGDAWFERTTFSGPTEFGGVSFSGTTWFGGARFSAITRFERTTFSGPTKFGSAKFSDITQFEDATFTGAAGFEHTTFSSGVWFERTTFSDTTRFESTTFSGPALFNGATFSGTARFVGVNFGTKPISFANPKQWGPPAPVFDWDQDLTQKPANVEPQDWPPNPAA